MDGFIENEEIRKTLNTSNWEKAQEIILEWEAKGKRAAEPEPVTIAEAWEEFLADAKARNLRKPTIYKYDLLSRQMAQFVTDQGIPFLRQLDLPTLRKFRATWPNQNLGALKKLEYLRAFFRFAHESRWIDENPARNLESPKVKQSPTMPFDSDQMVKILRFQTSNCFATIATLRNTLETPTSKTSGRMSTSNGENGQFTLAMEPESNAHAHNGRATYVSNRFIQEKSITAESMTKCV